MLMFANILILRKINILPALDIFKESSKVPYYTDEEHVREKWPKEILSE